MTEGQNFRQAPCHFNKIAAFLQHAGSKSQLLGAMVLVILHPLNTHAAAFLGHTVVSFLLVSVTVDPKKEIPGAGAKYHHCVSSTMRETLSTTRPKG